MRAFRSPLSSQGTKLSFESRVPTRYELNNCEHVDMCSRDPWDPRSVVLQSLSVEMEDNIKLSDGSYAYLDSSDEVSIMHSMDNTTVNLKEKMIKEVRVASTKYEAQVGEDKATTLTMISNERHLKFDENVLAERFGISNRTARATLEATHQNGTRSALLPLSRRYKADRRYQLRRLDGKFATDTFFSKHKSLLGNTCTQLYSTKLGFNAPYHMSDASGKQVGQSLKDFIYEWGVPGNLVFDGAMAQKGRSTEFMKTLRKHNLQ